VKPQEAQHHLKSTEDSSAVSKNATTKVIVLGAGIAGIAAAIRLKLKGYQVQVIEKNDTSGGKIAELKAEGFRFDMGPSLMTKPELFDELFYLANKNPRNYFKYERLSNITNYYWADGTFFKANGNPVQLVNDIHKTFNENPSMVTQYLKLCSKIYNLTEKIFLNSPLISLKTYLDSAIVPILVNLASLQLSRTVAEINKKYFQNSKARQLFNRFSTYNGSNPYEAPGVLINIPHLELVEGAFYPAGGIRKLISSLYTLSLELGIEYKFKTEIISVEVKDYKKFNSDYKFKSNNITSLISNSGREFTADRFIVACDQAWFKALVSSSVQGGKQVHLQNEHLECGSSFAKLIKTDKLSSSAVLFYWGVKLKSALDLHNILFSEDYQSEFNEIFKLKVLPEDPTIYINISSKKDYSDAPESYENWFVMVNCTAKTSFSDAEIEALRNRVIKKIENTLDLHLEDKIIFEEILNPARLAQRTNSIAGALYGERYTDSLTSFTRAQNKSSSFKNTFFTGGTVHPGGGMPLCLLSAKIVVENFF
jgi:phytoene desaturase